MIEKSATGTPSLTPFLTDCGKMTVPNNAFFLGTSTGNRYLEIYPDHLAWGKIHLIRSPLGIFR